MTDHAHHFRIETPTGPTVEGRCKHCGETRVYRSSGEPGYIEAGSERERRQYREKKHDQAIGRVRAG